MEKCSHAQATQENLTQPQTTAQQLGSLIKSARDIMRKDKGLNGDLDRLPMLTWVMFLEVPRRPGASRGDAGGHRRQELPHGHRTALPLAGLGRQEGRHHRRRAHQIHQQRRGRPAGRQRKGAGLFACLRALQGQNGDGRRDVIANVFRGVQNRMISGYLRCIKHELLTEFNLHTIVRLPNGVFAPYTSIPTNLLFFDCSGPTKTIWYYEQPLPDQRKNYTKTKPIQYEEFADCLKWWGKRKENGRAWKVKASDVIKLDDDRELGFGESRHQEPQCRRSPGTFAAGATGRKHLDQGEADHRDHGRDQEGSGGGGEMGRKKRPSKCKERRSRLFLGTRATISP